MQKFGMVVITAVLFLGACGTEAPSSSFDAGAGYYREFESSAEIKFEMNDNMHQAEFVSKVDGDTAWFLVDGEEVCVGLLAVEALENEPMAETLEKTTQIYLEDDDALWNKTDESGRYLAWVWCDGSLLQAELVEKGYAKVANIYGSYKYVDPLYDLEASRQQQK